MPSGVEMTAYARTLPPIYRDIMAAFPTIEPGRKFRRLVNNLPTAVH